MNVELMQGEAVVEVELIPGEHSVGGGAEDAVHFEGLGPALLHVRVDERRICVRASTPLQVDGVLIPPGVWRMLLSGETLELGSGCALRIAEETVTEEAAPPTGMVFRELLQHGTPDPRGIPSLTCLTGLDMGRSWPLSEGVRVLGRGADAEIRIRDRAASRRHARLVAGTDGYLLESLGSPNGIFVNGKRLEGAQTLASGDVIEFGRTLLRIHLPAREEAPLPEAPAPASDAEEVHVSQEAQPPREVEAKPVGRRRDVAGPGEWLLIGIGAGLTLMGALMGVGVLP